MLNVYEDSGLTNDNGTKAYEVIDPAIEVVFTVLLSKGYHVNDIYTLIMFSAADIRSRVVVNAEYGYKL